MHYTETTKIKIKVVDQVKSKCASRAAPMTKNHVHVTSECKKGLGKVSNKNLRSQDTWLDVQSQAGDGREQSRES